MSTDATFAEGHVSDADAFTIRMERDPLLRSTIVAVATLDRSPDWEHLQRRVDRATRLAPSFRSKLVESPFRLAPPRWVIDPDFDLSWHLRRLALPHGSDPSEVLDFARTAGMTAFDRDRPMWGLTLLEGLPDGKAALVIKVHHALTDGIGGIQIAHHAVDLGPEPVEYDLPPEPVGGGHGLLVDLVESVGHDVRAIADGGRSLAAGAPDATRRTLGDPLGTAADVARTAASLARFVRPVVATCSPIMRERRLRWHYDLLDVPLEPLKAAAAKVDGSLNDAFVAGVAGGMRRYHDQHGSMLDRMRVSMPISLRNDFDPEGGNHITLTRFEVPVARADPLRRIAEVGEVCRSQRRQPALAYSNQVAAALNLLPAAAVGGMLKHVDVVASNVPGFPVDVYVSGAKLESFHPFGPTIGASANITLMSYRGTCHIGITTDVGAVHDPHLFSTCLREAFGEIAAAGRTAGDDAPRSGPEGAAPPVRRNGRRPVSSR